MKKRIISLLLVFAMVFSLVPTTAFAATNTQGASAELVNPFRDVKETDWFYDAVQYARLNGFFSGTGKTTFEPNGPMTRGMFVTVLGRMAGVNTADYSGETPFSDVPQSKYYAPYVLWAAKHGITGGTGDGKFSPDALIDRQQMAAFFVRYFEAFGVNYETGADIATTPADLDRVQSYAKDAVLKLWKQGLLNGDGVNFDPTGNASRAQAATLCMRTDEVVETWYREPGVASERVRIDLAAGGTVTPEKPTEPAKPSSGGSSGGSSSGGGTTTTDYHSVSFAMGKDQTAITLPAAKTVSKGTAISTLPTPIQTGVVFLGWYYDFDLTDAVEMGDTVTRNLTLDARTAAGEEVQSIETPNYITKTEEDADQPFTFDVVGVGSIIVDGEAPTLKFINVTGGNMDVAYTVNDSTVSAVLEAGQTYKVELLDDKAQYKLTGDEEPQSVSIRYLNILTAKQRVKNAELNDSVKQIDVSTTSGLADSVFKGLYQIDESNVATQNTTSGMFSYTGEALKVGDVLAIKDNKNGTVNLNDPTSTEGDVAYIKITEVKGNGTYGYEMADVEDVLFIPDVLPIQNGWDADGDSSNNSITISAGNLSTALRNVDADSLDVGDFLSFINGTYSENAAAVSYGQVTGYRQSGDNFIITYDAYDTQTGESKIESALDVYYTQDREITLNEAERKRIEDEIKSDVTGSGYVEQAAAYLAAVMLESDNLETVPDRNAVALTMDSIAAYTTDGIQTYATDRGIAVHSGEKKVTVEFDASEINVKLGVNSRLDHLQGNGFNVEINIPFTVKIGDNVEIAVTAKFEEEIILRQRISTQRIRLGFLRYDYALNASFEVGNYTGIQFTADITAGGEEDGSMIEKLDAIMDRMESYHEAGGVADTGGGMDGLAEIYQEVMENANDAWFDIVEVQLFDVSGSVFLHIFCYQVKGSFVVSANLAVSMGMSFDYITQKQYNFSVRVKSRQTTNETIDIITPQYNFDFYVVGTLGIRAGIRLEMYVGLFSLKLDKIGISAEAGAYTRLWGYFFYHLNWTQGQGKESTAAGAVLIEIGIYLDIKFVAQLLSSEKLTWAPTIYANEWPLWSAGEQENIYAFANTDDTEYELTGVRTLTLPSSTYTMNYMDLKSGEQGSVGKDDSSESAFEIYFTNEKFSYAPVTNTVTIDPGSSVDEETDMVITFKQAALAFSTTPMKKVIHIAWSDPANARTVNLQSEDGSFLGQLTGSAGSVVTLPTPVRKGYIFKGWFTDPEFKNEYKNSTITLPADESEKVIPLYAKWASDQVSYTVKHYLQQTDGSYKLYGDGAVLNEPGSQKKIGWTDHMTEAQKYSIFGYTAQPVEQKRIAGDGSTVVNIYYDRANITITWDMNDGGEPIKVIYRYGEMFDAFPAPSREGYTFKGWYYHNGADKLEAGGKYPVPSANTIYHAKWEGNDNTVTFDLNYDGSNGSTATVKTGNTITEPTAPTRTDYRFSGWYTDRACTRAWDFAADTVPGDMTLYAKWVSTLAEYTVRHYQQNLDNDEYTEITADCQTLNGTKGTQTAAAAKVYKGFEAKPFAQQTIAEDGSTVASIYYDRTRHTVTWLNWNGDELGKNENVKYGAKPSFDQANPIREETGKVYIFNGWNTAQDGSGTAWDENTIVTENVTYYAQFTDEVLSYKITYQLNGGTNPADAPASYTYASGAILPTPTYAGCTFGGWYTDVGFTGEAVTEIAANTTTGDKTYYAKWTTSYTVNHYQQKLEGAEYTLESSQTLTGVVGAQTEAVGKSYTGFVRQSFEQSTIAPNTIVNIYYDRQTYTVTWKNGDAVLKTDAGVRYGAAVSYSGDAPVKAETNGYTYAFSGQWNTQKDGTGTAWTADTIATSNVTYYAQFTQTAKMFQITYDLAGGTNPADAPTSYTYGVHDITLPTPTKENYVFDGWYYTDDAGIERKTSTIPSLSYGDRHFTAKWSDAKYTVTFDPNGGTLTNAGDAERTNVVHGTLYGTLPEATRSGYVFAGWYMAAEGGEQVSADMAITSTHTIYAHWTWNGESSATTTYEGISGEVPLWFGDTQLSYTDENNKVDIGGVKSVRYDATDGYTVTLCGYTYSAAPSYRHELGLSCAVLYNGNVPLTIVLEGENTITPKKVEDYITGLDGILSTSDQTLTIEGDGTLNITIEPAVAAYGIYSNGDLIVNGGVLNAASIAYPTCEPGDEWQHYYSYKLAIGIRANNMTVNGGTVTAAGGLVDPHTGTTDSEREYHGIALGYTNSILTVYGGTLVVKSLGASVVGYNYFALREDYATAPGGKIWATEDLDGKDPIEWPSEEEWQCSFSYMKFIGANSNG